MMPGYLTPLDAFRAACEWLDVVLGGEQAVRWP
jgi:hypothetical protein